MVASSWECGIGLFIYVMTTSAEPTEISDTLIILVLNIYAVPPPHYVKTNESYGYKLTNFAHAPTIDSQALSNKAFQSLLLILHY